MVSNILIMKTDKNIIWVIALHVITFTFVIISWNHSFNNIGFNIVSGISCILLGGSYLYLVLSKGDMLQYYAYDYSFNLLVIMGWYCSYILS